MIAALLSSRFAKPALYGFGVGVIILLCWALIVWYGASRYRAGENAADTRWVEAGERLARQAAASSDKATKNEAPRIEAHLNQVADEKERIDEAVAAGSSPFDVLFGGVPNDNGNPR